MKKRGCRKAVFFIGSHFEIVFEALKAGYFLDIIKVFLGHN